MGKQLVPLFVNCSTLKNNFVVHDALQVKTDFQHHFPSQEILPHRDSAAVDNFYVEDYICVW
jgi:hypothetical protein